LRGGTEVHLHLNGTVLRDVDGTAIGLLIVMHDVTQLRRLERVRSEFITNVSHELRTPLSSIKASAETLMDGALGDTEHAERFVETIARQSDQMMALIDDIFSLARIEKNATAQSIDKESCPIAQVLESASAICRHFAQEKRINLHLSCDRHLVAEVNSLLLQQAVINLIDNAIKYSDEGSEVRISAAQVASDLVIEVVDQGCGIESSHLSRLFERFYRVDRARSRDMGGTGLGLAIVKHIALAHGGSVDVASCVGQGSTFRIRIPDGQNAPQAPATGRDRAETALSVETH
jgi:two-component system phosphate regulon sensor histidine kinase PhoR